MCVWAAAGLTIDGPRLAPGLIAAGGLAAQAPGPSGAFRGLIEPGGDLLFRALRRSTIGAEGFHGRVRDGIGCYAPRYGHQAIQKADIRDQISEPRRLCFGSLTLPVSGEASCVRVFERRLPPSFLICDIWLLISALVLAAGCGRSSASSD